jgi:hypothetical protein
VPLPTNAQFDAERERMREVVAEPIAELKELLELIYGGLNRPRTPCPDIQKHSRAVSKRRSVAVSRAVRLD